MDEQEALNRLRKHQAHRRADEGEPLLRPDARLPEARRHARRRRADRRRGRTTTARGTPTRVFEWGPEQTVFHPDQDPTRQGPRPLPLAPLRRASSCGTKTAASSRTSSTAARTGTATRWRSRSEFRGLPMGYYSANHLPVYDHLARNYCVCDAWHASIPGDTWPNRLYSLAGREADSIGHQPGSCGSLSQRLRGCQASPGSPTRRSSRSRRSPASSRTRSGAGTRTTRRRCAPPTPATATSSTPTAATSPTSTASGSAPRPRLLEAPLVGHDSFLDDAAKGELRDVSWIDPNFIDLSVLDPNSNDDHPPSDIRAGQALVLELYEALVNSPNWEDTLLVDRLRRARRLLRPRRAAAGRRRRLRLHHPRPAGAGAGRRAAREQGRLPHRPSSTPA